MLIKNATKLLGLSYAAKQISLLQSGTETSTNQAVKKRGGDHVGVQNTKKHGCTVRREQGQGSDKPGKI